MHIVAEPAQQRGEQVPCLFRLVGVILHWSVMDSYGVLAGSRKWMIPDPHRSYSAGTVGSSAAGSCVESGGALMTDVSPATLLL